MYGGEHFQECYIKRRKLFKYDNYLSYSMHNEAFPTIIQSGMYIR